MEKSEPTFVPQWLKSSGNVTGGASSAHHSALFPSHPATVSLGNPARNNSSKCSSDYDSPRSVFLERTTSSTSRRNSNTNGLARRPYSSFRSHRDKDFDKEKSDFLLEHWDNGLSDPVASIFAKSPKDAFCSRSMVFGRHGDAFTNKCNDNHVNNSGTGKNVVSSIQKTSFGKKIPSFEAEEKLVEPDSGRVSSSGLRASVQNLPSSTSSVVGGEGWSSVLAEVSSVVGSSNNGSASVQTGVQAAASPSVFEPPNMVSGLNMAETLVQAPSRAQSSPQLYDQTQRLEELALKQSRQLIPMTPTSKASGINCADKGKLKTLSKSAEMTVAAKNGQQQQQQQQLTAPNVGSRFKSDASNGTQVGKFLVLKPVWDNNGAGARDGSISTNDSVNGAASPAATPSVGRISGKPRSSSMDRKPCSAQARSRNDFFNLMRKKSSSAGGNRRPPALAASDPVSSPSAGEFADNAECAGNGGAEGRGDGVNSAAARLEEEEARFLRSLGWEEEACGDDEGLTEEEINSFFELYVKSKPSPRSSLQE